MIPVEMSYQDKFQLLYAELLQIRIDPAAESIGKAGINEGVFPLGFQQDNIAPAGSDKMDPVHGHSGGVNHHHLGGGVGDSRDREVDPGEEETWVNSELIISSPIT